LFVFEQIEKIILGMFVFSFKHFTYQLSSRKIAESIIKEPVGNETFCLLCGERHMHPSAEDLIQCGMCHEWAHEA
jgi:hypothetical protein